MKAVLLAGGKGTRLKPFTTNFPKPLMPIGDQPILEIVLKRLKKFGFGEIILTTGHLEGLIRAFFQDGAKLGLSIDYSLEDEPLGTAGPLNLIRDQLNETFLMMNGDVLTDMKFDQLLQYHNNNNAVATVALCKRSAHIDFGVVKLDRNQVFSEWNEKPVIDYLVSTGIYILEPYALEFLPEKGFFNLPDLIVKLSKENEKVVGYIHEGYWLDIGRPDDYEKACDDVDRI